MQNEFDFEKVIKQIDKKMSRDEAIMKFENFE